MSYDTYYFNYAGYYIEVDAKKQKNTKQSNCCVDCNLEYHNNDNFCLHCGKKLEYSEKEYFSYNQIYIPTENRIHIAGHQNKNWIIPLDDIGYLHRECRGLKEKKDIKISEYNEMQIFNLDEFREYMKEVFDYLNTNNIPYKIKMGIVSDWC